MMNNRKLLIDTFCDLEQEKIDLLDDIADAESVYNQNQCVCEPFHETYEGEEFSEKLKELNKKIEKIREEISEEIIKNYGK